MKWRQHTQRPEQLPVTAIIAVLDPDTGERYLLWGIYTFTEREQRWWNEETSEGVKEPTFWWMPEEELLAAIGDDAKRAEIPPHVGADAPKRGAAT